MKIKISQVNLFQVSQTCSPLLLSLLIKPFRQILMKWKLVVFCCCSVAQLCRLILTPWTAARQASLSFTISWSLLKVMSIESVVSSNHIILCHPLLFLPSIFPSIRVFSNESALRIRWPKYWSFSFSISPSSEYSGLTSFRKDWFDLLAVQGTLKSLFQHHSSKVSLLWHSAFFMVQLTSVHDYWKNHSFDYMDFCWQSNVSALNMLSVFVIAFPPISKCLSISDCSNNAQ